MILKFRLKPRRKEASLKLRPRAKRKYNPCPDTMTKYQNSTNLKSKYETNMLLRRLEWRRKSENK